jgi:hypothetical protein
VELDRRARRERERERMRIERERCGDVLARTSRLVRAPAQDDDLGAVPAETGEALGGRRRPRPR